MTDKSMTTIASINNAPDESADTFADRLSVFIQHVARSQREFADSLDELPANVSNYVRGTNPPISFLEKVARRYPSASMLWFVSGEGQMMHRPKEPNVNVVLDLLRRFVQEEGQRVGLDLDQFSIEATGGRIRFVISGELHSPGFGTD